MISKVHKNIQLGSALTCSTWYSNENDDFYLSESTRHGWIKIVHGVEVQHIWSFGVISFHNIKCWIVLWRNCLLYESSRTICDSRQMNHAPNSWFFVSFLTVTYFCIWMDFLQFSAMTMSEKLSILADFTGRFIGGCKFGLHYNKLSIIDRSYKKNLMYDFFYNID